MIFVAGELHAQPFDLFTLHEKNGGEISSNDLARVLELDSLSIPSYGFANRILEFQFFHVPKDSSERSYHEWVTRNQITPTIKKRLVKTEDGDIIAFQKQKRAANAIWTTASSITSCSNAGSRNEL